MRSGLLLPLLLASCASIVAQGPSANAPQQPESVFRTHTQLVTLDIVATDRWGNTVTDLRPEELKVFEDGVPRSVDNFSVEQQGKAGHMPESLRRAVAKEGSGTYTNFADARKVASGDSLIVLIDFANTKGIARIYMMQGLRDWLKKYDGSQPVVVYALGNNGLRMVHDFTTDGEALRAALDIRPKGGRGAKAANLRLPNPQELEDAAQKWQVEWEDVKTDRSIDRALAAFGALARKYQAFPGRKKLIWISSSFPLRIPDVFNSGIDPCTGRPFAPEYEEAASSVLFYQNQVVAAGRALASANLAVYPVDANGLTADYAGIDRNYTNVSIQCGTGRDATRQMPMRNLAEATGGKAYVNKNFVDAGIGRAMNDARTFYEIAFHPHDTKMDGSLHKLKVETSRHGVHLRYRESYYALDKGVRSKAQELSDEFDTAQALFAQTKLSTGILLAGSIDTQQSDIVNLWIDATHLSFDAGAQSDGRVGAPLQVTTATFDRNGKMLFAKSVSFTAAATLSKVSAIRQDGLDEKLRFTRPEAAARVRISVRDVASGRLGTLDIPLSAANTQTAAQ